MIRPLRRAHRAASVALALALPLGLAAALMARPDPPAAVLEGLVPPGASGRVVAEWEVPELGLAASLLAEEGGPRWLTLVPADDPREADVLVYWTAAPGAGAEALAAGARLLGTLAGAAPRAFALPPEVAGGRLVLFGLAHQEVLATSALPEVPR